MKRKSQNYDYQYIVYCNGCTVGIYSTRKDSQSHLSICKLNDKHSYILVVCYGYDKRGYISRIGRGKTQKEARADLSKLP